MKATDRLIDLTERERDHLEHCLSTLLTSEKEDLRFVVQRMITLERARCIEERSDDPWWMHDWLMGLACEIMDYAEAVKAEATKPNLEAVADDGKPRH